MAGKNDMVNEMFEDVLAKKDKRIRELTTINEQQFIRMKSLDEENFRLGTLIDRAIALCSMFRDDRHHQALEADMRKAREVSDENIN